MLVLSRQKNESIMIADGEIVITVIDIRGDKVRLGIEAPKDISIHREEVFNAIQRAEKKAAETGDSGPLYDVSKNPGDKLQSTD